LKALNILNADTTSSLPNPAAIALAKTPEIEFGKVGSMPASIVWVRKETIPFLIR